MTIKKTLKVLTKLRKEIKADGKVDLNEVDVLIEFMKPYCLANNEKFCKFNRVLLEAKKDSVIDLFESKAILKDLDFIVKFLKIEKCIDTFISMILLLIFCSIIAYAVLR